MIHVFVLINTAVTLERTRIPILNNELALCRKPRLSSLLGSTVGLINFLISKITTSPRPVIKIN